MSGPVLAAPVCWSSRCQRDRYPFGMHWSWGPGIDRSCG